MPMAKDDLKAKLLAQTEATLEKMLSDSRVSEKMTITEIEDVIGEAEKEFRERVLAEMVDVQEERDLNCPVCDGKLRNKGKRAKRLVTLRGESDINRRYYQCESCGEGYFPPR